MRSHKTDITVIDWDANIAPQAYALLHKYKETSLYLLAILNAYGPKLTDASHSGDFKCIIVKDKVVGVFVILPKVAHLLVQTDRLYDYTQIIVNTCYQSNILIKEVVGEWNIAQPIWNQIKQQNPNLQEILNKKSILLQKDLRDIVKPNTPHTIRYLQVADYVEWDNLDKAFREEYHLDKNEEVTARHKRFLLACAYTTQYGLFMENNLVAIACYNANIDGIGQIGAVYTKPTVRRRGLAKTLTSYLLWDGKTHKNMQQVILSTLVDSVALKLYKHLGFKNIGYFGIFSGKYGN